MKERRKTKPWWIPGLSQKTEKLRKMKVSVILITVGSFATNSKYIEIKGSYVQTTSLIWYMIGKNHGGLQGLAETRISVKVTGVKNSLSKIIKITKRLKILHMQLEVKTTAKRSSFLYCYYYLNMLLPPG